MRPNLIVVFIAFIVRCSEYLCVPEERTDALSVQVQFPKTARDHERKKRPRNDLFYVYSGS